MNNYSINPVKQNIRVKQYIGWFTAVVFPFAARGIMEISQSPLLAAVTYWVVCGVLLRYILEERLPYFNPQITKVKKETIILFVFTVFWIYLSWESINISPLIIKDIFLNIIFYALFNGVFEPIVLINIFELAGSRQKIAGFLASVIFVALLQYLFWNRVILPSKATTFFLIQAFNFSLLFVIYVKTRDITIWSIQHIIYSIAVILFSGFGINLFLHL